MNPKYQSILLITIVAFALILMHYSYDISREDFANKHTKAQAIYNWFQNNPSPTYTGYKRDLNNKSNIVEYEDALRLFQNRNLTVDTVENIL